MTPRSRTLDAVLEVLTQRRALSRAAALARTGDRQAALRLAREERDVAELLWPSGRAAAALRSAVASLDAYERALDSDADDDVALAETGLTRAEIATLRRARTVRAASAPLPDEDGALATTHADSFAELLAACDVLDGHLAFELRSTAEVKLARSARAAVVCVASLVVGALFAAAWTLPFSPSITVRASAIYNDDPRYAPELAIDGDPTTEWLLPDASTGALEVRLSPARDVRHVRLWNGHNYALYDRGVGRYRLELWSASRRVTAVEGELSPAQTGAPGPVDVPVRGHSVDRVRLVVLSWHVHGASLAELEVR